MPYNEITRVQIPALMHLAKLGYNFISQKDKPNLDTATNILTDSFTQAFERLNPNPTKNAQDALAEMKKRLNYDDLGKSFYEYLLKSERQIIDFDNPNNNLYEMMTELPYKSFRPDITLFINGLPLVNIEVKQPYAGQGIKEEKDRHIQRYENPENKVFYNLAQIWLFSDNLPYDGNNPDQGVFYSASYSPIFQRFVESNKLDITPPPPENEQSHQNHQNHRSLEEIQKRVLKEFNLKDTDTPKSPKDTPTNSLLTSFCSHKRLCFILKYGISFLKEKSELKKHVWRYAQMFASLNVLKELQKHYETNPKDPLKGIIWHTQGSSKTALTYHLTKLIRDFFSRSNLNKKTKFYFLDPNYLYYYITQDKIIHYLQRIAECGTSSYPSITPLDLLNVKIKLYPLETQQKIARTLSVLDQKIENNHKINELLHKILELLYEQYFVRFDFLDENNKPYQTSGGKMKFSKELNRLIPNDFEVKTLGDNPLCNTIKTGVTPFKQKVYYETKHIQETLSLNQGLKVSYNKRPNRANMQPSIYSVWFAKMKDTKKHLFLNQHMQSWIKESILSTGFCGLQCQKHTFEYIASTIKYSPFETRKNNLATGATQKAINIEALDYIFILIPNKELLNNYSKITKPLYEKISNNIIETQTLTALRDFLLPLLLKQQVKPQ